ncbi:ATPase [Salmonella enterica]|nr:ATPase [Salmonella enterica]
MKENGFNQSQVARAIGKSPATINQFLQGKYAGDTKTLETEISSFIHRECDKKSLRAINAKFVMTTTAKKALNVCRLAHLDCDINVIFGDAGMGKTMILREYAASNADAILIETDPGYTARVVLDELCNKLGISRRGTLHEMSDNCIAALAGTGRLLLIDEAENLPYRALETIRRIHDKAGIGVILAGMPRLIINLKGRKGEYKQLYSRVGLAFPVGDVLPRDDVRTLAGSILPGSDSEGVNETLYKVSKGNARRLFKLLRGVNRHCVISGEEVTAEAVTEFSQMLIS